MRRCIAYVAAAIAVAVILGGIAHAEKRYILVTAVEPKGGASVGRR